MPVPDTINRDRVTKFDLRRARRRAAAEAQSVRRRYPAVRRCTRSGNTPWRNRSPRQQRRSRARSAADARPGLPLPRRATPCSTAPPLALVQHRAAHCRPQVRLLARRHAPRLPGSRRSGSAPRAPWSLSPTSMPWTARSASPRPPHGSRGRLRPTGPMAARTPPPTSRRQPSTSKPSALTRPPDSRDSRTPVFSTQHYRRILLDPVRDGALADAIFGPDAVDLALRSASLDRRVLATWGERLSAGAPPPQHGIRIPRHAHAPEPDGPIHLETIYELQQLIVVEPANPMSLSTTPPSPGICCWAPAPTSRIWRTRPSTIGTGRFRPISPGPS